MHLDGDSTKLLGRLALSHNASYDQFRPRHPPVRCGFAIPRISAECRVLHLQLEQMQRCELMSIRLTWSSPKHSVLTVSFWRLPAQPQQPTMGRFLCAKY